MTTYTHSGVYTPDEGAYDEDDQAPICAYCGHEEELHFDGFALRPGAGQPCMAMSDYSLGRCPCESYTLLRGPWRKAREAGVSSA